MNKLYNMKYLVFLLLIGFSSCSGSDQSQNRKDIIPGFTAAVLYNQLENKGFRIDKQADAEFFFVDCDRSQSEFNEHVRIAGESYNEISEIRASYTNFSTGKTIDLCKPFISYIATLPYTNAEPETAKKWVIDNLGKNIDTLISGVKFKIVSNRKNIQTLFITTDLK